MIFLLLMLSCVNFKLENREKITQEEFCRIIENRDLKELINLKEEIMEDVDLNYEYAYGSKAYEFKCFLDKPLTFLARKGEVEIVRFLVEELGIDPYIKDRSWMDSINISGRGWSRRVM